jgi:hypothetical protein
MMLWWILALIQRQGLRIALLAKPAFLMPSDALPGIESARNAHFFIVTDLLRLAAANAHPAPASHPSRSPAPVLARI